VLSTAAVCLAPPAGAADTTDWPQPGSQPADVIKSELQSMGYDVAINWVNNGMGVPLARCHVTGYHGRGDVTTVYMDVVCPDED
jgi:hypothetical protein